MSNVNVGGIDTLYMHTSHTARLLPIYDTTRTVKRKRMACVPYLWSSAVCGLRFHAVTRGRRGPKSDQNLY